MAHHWRTARVNMGALRALQPKPGVYREQPPGPPKVALRLDTGSMDVSDKIRLTQELEVIHERRASMALSSPTSSRRDPAGLAPPVFTPRKTSAVSAASTEQGVPVTADDADRPPPEAGSGSAAASDDGDDDGDDGGGSDSDASDKPSSASKKNPGPDAGYDSKDKTGETPVVTPPPAKPRPMVEAFVRQYRRLPVFAGDTRARFLWDLVVYIVLMYNVFIVPWRIALRPEYKEVNNLLITLDYIGDFIWLLDIALNLMTSVIDRGILVTDPVEIFRLYLAKKLVRDVLSILPIDLASFDVIEHGLLRLNRPLLRGGFIVSYFDKWERYSRFPNMFRLCKLILIISLCAHVIGCCYHIIGYQEEFGSSDWLPPCDFLDNTLTTRYLYVLWWASSAMTGLGTIFRPPTTNTQRLFSLGVVFVGVFVFATVVGNVASVINNLDANLDQFRKKMDTIMVFTKNRNLPKDLRKRITSYYDHLWSRQQGVDDNVILNELPSQLRTDVSLYLNRELVQKVPLFQDCVPGFINSLVQHLRPQIYAPNDFVVRYGDMGGEMFFINRGHVEVLSQDDKVLVTLAEGSFFGEIALLYKIKRTASVRAKGFTTLFVLTKTDLDAVLENYPEQLHVVKGVAETRLSRDLLKDLLRNVSIFQRCDTSFHRTLASLLRPLQVSPGDVVVKAGDWGREMFFISNGVVEVLKPTGEPIMELTNGSYFGEIAVLAQTRRTATVVATSLCDLYYLTKDDLDDALERFPAMRREMEGVANQRLSVLEEQKRDLLMSVPIFKPRKRKKRQSRKVASPKARAPAMLTLQDTDAQMELILSSDDEHAESGIRQSARKLMDLVENVTVQAGELLARRGAKMDCMYVVVSGVLVRSKSELPEHADVESDLLSTGQQIGQEGLLSHIEVLWPYDVAAESTSELLRLSRQSVDQLVDSAESFGRFFGLRRHEYFKEVSERTSATLGQINMLRAYCTKDFLRELGGLCVVNYMSFNDHLLEPGVSSTRVSILLSGHVELFSHDGRKLADFTQGSMFGLGSIMSSAVSRVAARVKSDRAVALQVPKGSFLALFNGSRFHSEHNFFQGVAKSSYEVQARIGDSSGVMDRRLSRLERRASVAEVGDTASLAVAVAAAQAPPLVEPAADPIVAEASAPAAAALIKSLESAIEGADAYSEADAHLLQRKAVELLGVLVSRAPKQKGD